MALELADVIDLLRVGVEAGLRRAALTEVGRRHRGVLASRWPMRPSAWPSACREPSGSDGLCAAAGGGVAALAGAIERSERHGAPLGPALAALAVEARSQRARARVEHAARAAPKIQLSWRCCWCPPCCCWWLPLWCRCSCADLGSAQDHGDPPRSASPWLPRESVLPKLAAIGRSSGDKAWFGCSRLVAEAHSPRTGQARPRNRGRRKRSRPVRECLLRDLESRFSNSVDGGRNTSRIAASVTATMKRLPQPPPRYGSEASSQRP